MRKSKKLISIFLTVIMAFGVLTVAPVTVNAASCVKTQSEALSWLNSQEGARYDLDGAYGSQCSDFSSAYINYILYGNPRAGKFGVYNARDYSNKNLYPSDWQVIKNTPSFLPQPGDIFVTKGTTSFGHTGVVISSTVNNAKIADQNGMGDWSLDYGSPAHIHNITWTGSGTWCATYYIRPCFASNAPHTHNYNTYVYYWDSHPHYKCYKCSCGDIKEDRSQKVLLDTCPSCLNEYKATVKPSKYIYSKDEKVTISWNSVSGATHYFLWLYEINADGTTTKIFNNNNFNALKTDFDNLSVGRYYISFRTYNKNFWKTDMSDWFYSEADRVYFEIVDNTTPQYPLAKKTTVSLDKYSANVYIKGNTTIRATVKNGVGMTTYKSGNTKVARVDSKGKVTALKAGVAKITVTNNNVRKIFTITVKEPKLNKTSVSISRGKHFTLKIKGKIGKAIFKSSNKRVITVKSNGRVFAKKKGNASITVKTNGITLKSKVKVR